jgi:hypothetical protein
MGLVCRPIWQPEWLLQNGLINSHLPWLGLIHLQFPKTYIKSTLLLSALAAVALGVLLALPLRLVVVGVAARRVLLMLSPTKLFQVL